MTGKDGPDDVRQGVAYGQKQGRAVNAAHARALKFAGARRDAAHPHFRGARKVGRKHTNGVNQ